jgi:aspartyl-tRNA(Asn)/glutamyl-tRNA(Gln) amidotransferase subunit A
MDIRGPLTIDEALKVLRAAGTAQADLPGACLARIAKLDPELRAFITVCGAGGTPLPRSASGRSAVSNSLAGIPFAVKDLFDTAGVRTTVGSRFFADRVPAEDAFVVGRLRQAGALIIGKTNTHEIALGVTGDNPHYGTARNPWDTSRIPGGSSSGSAIAVATGMAVAALGTDTGGSIRVPAALCGVVGLKPTFGRVSTRGVFPLSWNLDHVGPLTACVKDAALVLQVICAHDPLDPSCVRMPADDYVRALSRGVQDQRIALAVGENIEAADAEVRDAVREAARVFESLGCSVREVDVEWMREASAANRLITQADGAVVHRDRLKEHPEMFGDDVRRRLEAGAATTVAEYVLARRMQVEVRRRCEELFLSQEILLLPTTPMAAPPIDGYDGVARAGQLTPFTAPFNLAGLPALSVPCGFTSAGLPIGLQIVSGAWHEAFVLSAGHSFERETGWHKRHPDL